MSAKASHGRIKGELFDDSQIRVEYTCPRTGLGFSATYRLDDPKSDEIQAAAVASLIDNITGGAEMSANYVIHELRTKYLAEKPK